MSCGLSCRHGLDLLLLWRRLAAVAPTRTLAWELSYDAGAALKRPKKKKKKKASRMQNHINCIIPIITEKKAYTNSENNPNRMKYTKKVIIVMFIFLLIFHSVLSICSKVSTTEKDKVAIKATAFCSIIYV